MESEKPEMGDAAAQPDVMIDKPVSVQSAAF